MEREADPTLAVAGSPQWATRVLLLRALLLAAAAMAFMFIGSQTASADEVSHGLKVAPAVGNKGPAPQVELPSREAAAGHKALPLKVLSKSAHIGESASAATDSVAHDVAAPVTKSLDKVAPQSTNQVAKITTATSSTLAAPTEAVTATAEVVTATVEVVKAPVTNVLTTTDKATKTTVDAVLTTLAPVTKTVETVADPATEVVLATARELSGLQIESPVVVPPVATPVPVTHAAVPTMHAAVPSARVTTQTVAPLEADQAGSALAAPAVRANVTPVVHQGPTGDAARGHLNSVARDESGHSPAAPLHGVAAPATGSTGSAGGSGSFAPAADIAAGGISYFPPTLAETDYQQSSVKAVGARPGQRPD